MLGSVVGTSVLLANEVRQNEFLSDTQREMIGGITAVMDIISTTMFAYWLIKK